MSDINILVVDDEREIADLVEIYLVNENYNVIKQYDGSNVINILENKDISLIILDIMMPGIDGISLCRNIRKNYNIPIIMLSAKTMDMDKVLGLSSGADDYITKPFNPIELIARVKAQIRRYTKFNIRQTSKNNIIEIKGLTINKESYTVKLYDEKIDFTPTEFELLYLLASNQDKVMSSEEIFESVWKEKYFEASNNTVMVHVRHIREKLGDNSKDPKFIKTVWGVGYKIEK